MNNHGESWDADLDLVRRHEQAGRRPVLIVMRSESGATMHSPFARQRNAHGQLVLDPCLICGISQAAHWKCRICTSRGHTMGRSALLPDVCLWCQDELLALLKRDSAN